MISSNAPRNGLLLSTEISSNPPRRIVVAVSISIIEYKEPTTMKLLTPAAGNTKAAKTALKHQQYRIVSLALAPAYEAKGISTCPNASNSCRNACVGGENVGLAGIFASIMKARIEKTEFLRTDRAGFVKQLTAEIHEEQRKAEAEGQVLACRLNTFSDIPWENQLWGAVPQQFPEVTFYDYSKLYFRAGLATGETRVPDNYHLCFSWTEEPKDQADCLRLLLAGFNVSMVFANQGAYAGNAALRQDIPKRWTIIGNRFEVYDGDSSDLRIPGIDPGPSRSGRGRICGLRLKAGNTASRNAAINSGFAVVVSETAAV